MRSSLLGPLCTASLNYARTHILALSQARKHWGCGFRPAVSSSLRFRRAWRSRSEGETVASPPHERQDAEQRMLCAAPGVPALGCGPAPSGDYARHEYHHPAAGWGAARSVERVLVRAGEPIEGFRALFLMNHEDGRVRLPRLRLARRSERSPPRHLRERRQARHLGARSGKGRPVVAHRLGEPPHRLEVVVAPPGELADRVGGEERARRATRTFRSPGTTRSCWSAAP
jgi:hypothetical protein